MYRFLWIDCRQIKFWIFVVPLPTGPENSGAFKFLIRKALLYALHCVDRCKVKSLPKAPTPMDHILF